jgi:dTMP kinase
VVEILYHLFVFSSPPTGLQDQDMPGFFITFEGIDFCGKTTQAKRVVSYLKRKGHLVLLVREPGGNQVAEKIRKVLLSRKNSGMTGLTELLLYEAARSQLTETVILPALKRGQIVICDRYADSSTAYQGYGRGLSIRMIDQLNRTATFGLSPDLTIVLDVPVSVSAKRRRLQGREKDRLEGERPDFHRRIRQGFLEIAQANRKRIQVVDGTGDIVRTWQKVKKVVDAFLEKSRSYARRSVLDNKPMGA